MKKSAISGLFSLILAATGSIDLRAESARGSVEDAGVIGKAEAIVAQAKSTKAELAATPQGAASRESSSMSENLAGASAAAKLEFLDSLVLVDGKIASAKVDLLRQELGDARVQALIKALAPNQKPVYKFDSAIGASSLCGNGVCNDSACRPHSSGSGKVLSAETLPLLR